MRAMPMSSLLIYRPIRPVALAALGTGLLGVQTAPPADVSQPASEAQRTPTGLATLVLKPGTGTQHPRPVDLVTVAFSLWSDDGTLLSSTAAQGAPASLLLDRTMKGMSEGLQLMVVGETRRMWIPESLVLKPQGRPAGPMLLDAELLAIEPPPTEAPPDVAAPPADAHRTPAGLAFRVLREGSGTQRAAWANTVHVHYTGWTTDGKMFDSSVLRRTPSSFRLDQVIKGWREGIPLMAPGEKTRFWIPEKLAYRGERGMPAGMLVFDIELLSIEP